MTLTKDSDYNESSIVDRQFQILMTDKSVISNTPTEVSTKDLPDWYDEKLFKEGQKYYQRNLLSMGLASLFGLLAVLAIPTTLKILVFTKQSSCPASAFRRYLQTLLHIYTLYCSDINDPKSNWWKSLNTIRWKHSTNSRRSGASGVGEISQRDMALTQFGFLGYALTVPEKLGLTNESQGRRGLNHFWRVVGHLLGISERMNLCQENEIETTKLCERLSSEVYSNWMLNPPENFSQMTSAMLDGFWCVDILVNENAMLYSWFALHNLKYKELNFMGKLNVVYRNTILYLLGIPYIGYLVRNGFNYWLAINYWIVERWPVIAWIRFGKEGAKINLNRKNN